MKVGLIGGSGLERLTVEGLRQVRSWRTSRTPWGQPSSLLTEYHHGDNSFVFLSRFGENHKKNPTSVNYAANIFALKEAAVTQVVSISAVGALGGDGCKVGDVVVPNDFIDYTRGRVSSFFTNLGAVHVRMDQPFCNRMRTHVSIPVLAASVHEPRYVSTPVYHCIEGPHFATRSESAAMTRRYPASGNAYSDVIGMTVATEAKLAAEAQMCYSALCVVTDDNGVHGRLSAELISGRAQAASARAFDAFLKALNGLSTAADCECRHSLETAFMTPRETVEKRCSMKVGETHTWGILTK